MVGMVVVVVVVIMLVVLMVVLLISSDKWRGAVEMLGETVGETFTERELRAKRSASACGGDE